MNQLPFFWVVCSSELWVCSMILFLSLLRESVPWVCSMILFRESVPWFCSVILFRESVPWVCSMSLFHESVPWVCSFLYLVVTILKLKLLYNTCHKYHDTRYQNSIQYHKYDTGIFIYSSNKVKNVKPKTISKAPQLNGPRCESCAAHCVQTASLHLINAPPPLPQNKNSLDLHCSRGRPNLISKRLISPKGDKFAGMYSSSSRRTTGPARRHETETGPRTFTRVPDCRRKPIE